MAIGAGDIKFYLTGGVGNSDPNLSLGGAVSNTEVSTSLHGLFDAVSSDEASAGDVEYRIIHVKNTHVSLTAYNAVLYISSETTSIETTIALAYDSVGTQTIATESTPPTSVSFSTPLSKATGISLGDIAPAATKCIILKRTVTAGASAASADTGELTVSIDTAP